MLRLVLRLDALTCGVSGVVLLIDGPMLADQLGTPLGVLQPLGVLLVAFAATLWAVEARLGMNERAVWAVIILNGVWVAASLLAVLLGWLPLTGLGTGLVIAQAALTALVADLEFVGLRREVAPAA